MIHLTRRACLALALAAGSLAASIAHAAVLTVAPGGSIANALIAAQPGDTIEVARGEYREALVIDKPVTLIGLGRPTIKGSGSGDVIRVNAADVTIRGFIVRDSGIDQRAKNSGISILPGAHRARVETCEVVQSLFGIWVERADHVRIAGNTITGRRDLPSVSRGNGIQIFASADAEVIGNRISHARDGIYVDWSRRATFRGNRIHHLRYGTHYMNTHDSVWENNEVYMNRGGLALMEVRSLTVRNNIAWGNEDHGIMLRTIQDSVIENNVVAGNGRGFFIYDAEYNVVRGNLVTGNEVGVHLSAGSGNNAVDGNDFIDNVHQVKYVATRDTEWGREQGNYWSNYSGWDQNGDGSGDVAYEANDLVDRLVVQYPLLKLVMASPSLQTLRFVARQFPVLRTPSVVDRNPRMQPRNQNWRNWRDKRIQ